MKKERSLEAPSELLKEDIDIAPDSSLTIVKYWPSPEERDRGEKGGIIVSVKAPEVEEFMKMYSSPKARENPIEVDPCFLESPLLYRPVEPTVYYRGWADGSPFTFENGFYRPDFNINHHLIGPDNTINLMFLRAEGLSEGVHFKIQDIYDIEAGKKFAVLFERMVSRFYNQILKRFEVTITISPGKKSVPA